MSCSSALVVENKFVRTRRLILTGVETVLPGARARRSITSGSFVLEKKRAVRGRQGGNFTKDSRASSSQG